MNFTDNLKRLKRDAEALRRGFADGWRQGPELSSGISYSSTTEPSTPVLDRRQDVYDAGTHIGCGAAVLTRRGWAKVTRGA